MTTWWCRLAAGTAVALAVGAALAGCSGGSSTAGSPPAVSASTPATSATGPAPAGSAAVPTPTGSRPVGPPRTDPAGTPSVAISTAAVVKTGTPREIMHDVLIDVRRVVPVTVKAEQPGQVAGPATAVTLRAENRSGTPFDLGGMVVTISYRDGVPGNETSATPSRPLTGALAPGASSEGVYVFTAPPGGASSVRVEVSSDASPTVLRFAP